MKLCLTLILSFIIIMTIPGAYAESVPNWVKNTAGWWATDAISEDEFVNAIEFLVNEGILVVESTNSSKTNESKIIDNFYGGRFNLENSPVIGLSWKRCQKYCKWRGKRLPTEK